MKSMQELYGLLLQQEGLEAVLKCERLLQFNKLAPSPLISKQIEGSYLTLSPVAHAALDSLNVARIQNTSAQGLCEIVRILGERSRHILVTAPLEVESAAYLELLRHGYAISHWRSVMGLWDSSKTAAAVPDVQVKSLGDDLADGFQVLNSFCPTSHAEFDGSYTYWLTGNNRAQMYAAYQQQEPVGIGILSWSETTGILSSGVVNPGYRGQGIQDILIHHRIREAERLGLKVLFAPGVPPFSASENNLRNCGFQLICTRAIWKKAEHVTQH